MIHPRDIRKPEHPVDPLFVERWSPRAFTGEAISAEEIAVLLEAARWAPSAFNSQPWRFVYARRGTQAFPRFVELLNPWNQGWAHTASAILFVASAEDFVRPGQTETMKSASHAFDTGAAWANFALQASLRGWHAHGIGGFDAAKAREVLGVPEGVHLQAAIALGRLGDKSAIPEGYHAGETPSGRHPVGQWAFEGGFGG